MRNRLAVTASILSIAIYFTLLWGFDALRILTSPNYGLEDAWRSQIVYWVARWIGFGPQALLQLSAVFGAVKLAVAGVFAVHIFDRLRALRSRPVDNDVLELGLLLVVGLTIATVAPAMWEHDATLIRTATLNLVLASLAAALAAVERAEQEPDVPVNRLARVMAEARADLIAANEVAAVAGDGAMKLAEPVLATKVTDNKPTRAWYAFWRRIPAPTPQQS
jgi:hypothetical protein